MNHILNQQLLNNKVGAIVDIFADLYTLLHILLNGYKWISCVHTQKKFTDLCMIVILYLKCRAVRGINGTKVNVNFKMFNVTVLDFELLHESCSWTKYMKCPK